MTDHETQSSGPSREGERGGGSEAGEAVAGEGEMPDVDRLREELDRLNDRHLRLAAEFDNFRKRANSQLAESSVRAQAQLVGTLLDVLDDLRRVAALDAASSTVRSLVDGVALVERKFAQTLEEAGLEEIHPEGEAFDPNLMEALQRVPAVSQEDDDIVDRVLQRGFRFRGHLVRPARVSVRKLE